MNRFFMFLFLFAGLTFFSEAAGVGKVKRVTIDAGHGGNKPGAVSKTTKEKNITLAIALKLGKLIEDNYSDVEVIYTRKTDVDVDLYKRTQIANRNKSDLFISIHVNSAFPKTDPIGTETYVMSLAKSSANLEVAKKENADILLEENYKTNYQGFDPNSPESSIMFALYQNAFLDRSLDFAAKIQKQFGQRLETVNRGVKQDGFLVLYQTAMPAVLVEIGFLSNLEEEEFMNSPQGQGEIAHCIFNAFREYKAQEEGATFSTNEKLVINIEGYDPSTKKPMKKPVKTDKEIAKKTEPTKDSKQPAKTPAANTEKETKPDINKKENTTPKKEEPKTVAVNIDSAKKETAIQKQDPKTIITTVDSVKKEMTVQEQKTNPTVTHQSNTKKGLEYRVQFFISKEKMAFNSAKFKELNDINVYEQDGVYRYTSGSETNVEDAKKILEDVKSKGFKDAFIISFHNNKRISLEEARKITETNN